MNHSMHGADRNTHIKVVVVGFLDAAIVVIAGFSARVSDVTVAGRFEAERIVIRAGLTTVTSNTRNTIR